MKLPLLLWPLLATSALAHAQVPDWVVEDRPPYLAQLVTEGVVMAPRKGRY
ncbi:hypothetical protein [Pseudomonas sp. BP8]|uniref:hypothetical protein n=1 Tax=Pseudomonas sp. BP8 TaxID=2817864 RepID=UPI001AE1B6E3|nr:hypothetical protein [Pseudomonas sp. BP8]MBP2261804.1 hypothetical protein [Pseudomonas sp. BP8]HDS1736718.1 hypothetical protein [Pseudomonas putida]